MLRIVDGSDEKEALSAVSWLMVANAGLLNSKGVTS